MRQLPTLITQTISHDDRQNSIHCCSSFYLLTTLKKYKSHLINILFIVQQAKQSDQQQWSDKTTSPHTHGEQKHMTKPTEGASTPQYRGWGFYEIGLPKAWFPSHGLLKIKCVHLEIQHRMLHVLTVSAWLIGKFQVSYESSPIHSVFAAARPGSHRLLRHMQETSNVPRHKNLEFKSKEWASHATDPSHPIHCSRMFKNIHTASKNVVEHHHAWATVCRSTSCNSSWRTLHRRSWYPAPVRHSGRRYSLSSPFPAIPACQFKVETEHLL
jgi:hypothetical protein